MKADWTAVHALAQELGDRSGSIGHWLSWVWLPSTTVTLIQSGPMSVLP
jgi:hypothetical protein